MRACLFLHFLIGFDRLFVALAGISLMSISFAAA